jgi:predicted ATPase/class 3 adenylate cyclase
MSPRIRDRAEDAMAALPSGIVTFLFTDIEGSSRLWERDRAAMARAVARHDALLTAAVAAQRGVPFKHVGDMVQAAFWSPVEAVAAAVAAQRGLAAEPWPETGPIRVRMGIHLGEAAPNARGDYNQIACLNRLSRMMSAGYGGQVLLSEAVRAATAAALPAGVTLRDLGRHRLRDLLDAEPIAQLVIAGLPADFPPIKTLDGHATNLPTLPTALLGREQELAKIGALLGEEGHRLVTLVGPGGVGKTHLALQAGADLLDRFGDGVWLVRLGEVVDPAMIVPAIAGTLGVREGGGLTMEEALVAWIGTKRLLFVLDNVEQVISGAPAVAGLLAACPELRILATSRQRLGIGGERVFPVQPLSVTAASDDATAGAPTGSPAVQLFMERAREVAPDLALDGRNGEIVAAVCARLDGLPLAIELAAAQLRTRTLPELQADLERRFDLLVGGRREALTHQHSLAATIAWSYERLDPEMQRLLQRLATFAGGWSREAAEQVAAMGGDAAGHLGALAEQSLIRRVALPGDVSRWSMLESIREFGRARLEASGESGDAHDRHAAWCLTFAEEGASRLDGAEQEQWLDRFDLEHDNARAALRWWAERGEHTRELALATALAIYWQTRGYLTEGRRWLEAALALATPDAPARLPAMVEAGILAQTQGDFPAAAGWFQQAMAIAQERGDRGREAALRNNLGAVAVETGDLDDAEERFSEALALAEALGDRRRRLDALGNLAAIAQYRGDLERALRYLLESLAIWRELGNPRGIADTLLSLLFAMSSEPEQRQRARAAGEESLRRYRTLRDPRGEALALTGLGMVASAEGDFGQAVSLHEEALDLARRIDDRVTEARALGNLGIAEIDRDNLERAASLLEEHLHTVMDLGDPDGLASALEALAALRTREADDARAAHVAGAAGALRERLEIPVPPESRVRHAETMETLRQRLGDRLDALLRDGATLSPEAAATEALARETGPPPGDSLATALQGLDDLLGLG